MDRARRATFSALIVVVLVASAAGRSGQSALALTIGWPVSSLVLSELQTGGVSASDEFAEIANQGVSPVDLAGLEVVYATASGSTVTRKAAWDDSMVLAPGRRVLLANVSGVYGPIADLTFSGGFAASGGALALRVIGGDVVDSIGWGDATNGFVEGSSAGAPPPGSSLERKPGGAAGNVTDTNVNAIDWFVQGSPSPQGLAAAPIPTASPTPTPGLTPTPVPTPSPVPTPTPVVTPVPTPTPAGPSLSPTPSPPVAPLPIAGARALPDGTSVTVGGVLTTELGALEAGRGAFVQDDSGGIAIYLDAPAIGWWPAGTTVVMRGSVSSRFSQRTLRLAESAIERGSPGALPTAIGVGTGAANEALEGLRVSVAGTIVGSPGPLADGIGITLDDGSGQLRAVIGMDALAGQEMRSGMTALLSGPLGQRDSSGTGLAGYRIYSTMDGEVLLAEGTPTPTPEPTPTPTPDATPEATGPDDPDPTATQNGVSVPVASARAMSLGSRVTVTAVVTAELGRLGSATLLAIGDASGGVAIHLPAGAAGFPRGTLLRIRGVLAAPYGQLEIRPDTGGIEIVGSESLPPTRLLELAGLDDSLEGQLVTVTGTLSAKPRRSSSGDLTMSLDRMGAAPVKLLADGSSQVGSDAFSVGATYRVTGVVGQRASRKDALDGYRLCLRDANDVVKLAGAAAPGAIPGSARPAGSGSPAGDVVQPSITIAIAIRMIDRDVAIDAVVTAQATLLDSTGRRIVVQDASAAIEVLLPPGAGAPPIGTRIHAEGRVGLAYGAPRLRAERLDVVGGGSIPVPVVLKGPPGDQYAWRLVTITGRIDNVHKLGDRWRADLLVGSRRVAVTGQPGSGIAVTALIEGRMAIVTGIVRPPYPTAADQRPAITPRNPADLRVFGRAPVSTGSSGGSGAAMAPDGMSGRAVRGSAPGSPAAEGAVDADLVELATFTGRLVRVGGLVVALRHDGFLLDDGTTVGLIVLRGAALELLPLLEPDDAINAIGHVEQQAEGPAVVVEDAGAIVQAGDPVAPQAPRGDGAIVIDPSAAVMTPRPPAAGAGLIDGPDLRAGLAGLVSLIALSLLSLAATMVQRRYARRRLEARIAARVAVIGTPEGRPDGARSAERGGSTIDSA